MRCEAAGGEPPPVVRSLGRHWSIARAVAGHTAALAMSLYLVVKVIWIVAALLGHGPDDVGSAGWVLLNTVTVGMSAIGVLLGLATARQWGGRLPGGPLLFFAWVGSGFLVPMLPYMGITGVLGAIGIDRDGGRTESGTQAPGWEMVLISVGFAGMAVGLAVALPIYLRERWPAAFLGRVGEGRVRSSRFAPAAMTVAVVLGLLWLYWAFGGTFGLDPAHRDHWDLNGRLLNGSAGLWALIGGWSVWVLGRRRPARLPRWVPITLAFTASGSLFAWSGWKLPMAVIRPGDYVTAEYTVVAVLQHTVSIGGGLALLAALLDAVVSADRRPSRSASP